ncbi:hypothetical protein [Halorubrum tebenquichense]|uniref:Uncharacterized protein n=1 Tax=Halorubrum tebenquichense DSM 14210 TaxID=1227485 RepID=M0E239_9EURY|nr:hypothetical protein [Halorubrum tebenquichense]ELZ41865.1 hypothetical protein C472_00439 [Halorubrum tebenquichense DSM 14210]
MADGDSSLSDDDQEFLLSGSEDLGESVDFDAATGIDAGNLARTVVGTLGLALGTAAATFVGGVTEAWTSLIDSLAEFLSGGRELVTGIARNLAPGRVYRDTDGLIVRVTESVTTPISNTWESTLPDSGIAAWIASLAIILLTFYAVARGVDKIQEVL